MMDGIILDFLNKLLSSAYASFDTLMSNMLENLLYIEKLFSSALSIESITTVYNYIYVFCCCLVALKFLTKGFKIYILWRDGDADSSIQDMLIGVAQSVVVMVGFPYFYGLIADITRTLSNGIMDNFGFVSLSMTDMKQLFNPQTGLFEAIILLIYAIMLLVLYIKLIQRGVELLVLRLGVPFACLGLLDSDFGVFKSYMQALIKTLFTVIIQITLFSLSIRLMTRISVLNILCGIAVVTTAFQTPMLLQSFLVPAGSTNIMNKISSGARIASTAKSLIGK